MEKLGLHSPDLTAQNIAKLAALFPNVVTESFDDDGNPIRAIDFDLLRQEVSDHVIERSAGALPTRLARQASGAVYRQCTDRQDIATGAKRVRGLRHHKNLFIEGDNLDALKLLQESYLGKVKLITSTRRTTRGTTLSTTTTSSQRMLSTRQSPARWTAKGNI